MSKKSKKIKGGGMVYSTDEDTMANLFAGIKINTPGESIIEDEQESSSIQDSPDYLKDRAQGENS